MFTVMYLTF